MSFLEAMQNRYTTKKYDPTQKIETDKIDALKEVLRLAPSSINSQPWQFTFVSNPEMKAKLSEVSWLNKERIQNSDTLVVFSRHSTLEGFEKQIEASLPEGAVNYYKEFIKPWPEHQVKAWFDRQLYLALGVFLSACANMDIDATPMEGIEPENYDKILGQTEYAAQVAVAIGHRDPEDFNQPEKKPKTRLAAETVIKTIA